MNGRGRWSRKGEGPAVPGPLEGPGGAAPWSAWLGRCHCPDGAIALPFDELSPLGKQGRCHPGPVVFLATACKLSYL